MQLATKAVKLEMGPTFWKSVIDEGSIAEA